MVFVARLVKLIDAKTPHDSWQDLWTKSPAPDFQNFGSKNPSTVDELMHQSKFRRLNLLRYHLSKWKAPGFGSCCTRCPNDVSFHAGTPAARQLGEKKENGGLFAESSHVKLLPGITPQPPLCYVHPGQLST